MSVDYHDDDGADEHVKHLKVGDDHDDKHSLTFMNILYIFMHILSLFNFMHILCNFMIQVGGVSPDYDGWTEHAHLCEAGEPCLGCKISGETSRSQVLEALFYYIYKAFIALY